MADLLSENFEGTGYELTWTESIGDGCTQDEDSTDETPPAGGGVQTLKSVSAATGYKAYSQHDYGSENSKSFSRIYVKITASNIGDGAAKGIFAGYNASTLLTWTIRLKDISGSIYFNFGIYNNGAFAYYDGDSAINLDQWYRLEIKYDDDANAWEWLVDGTSQDSGSLTGTHRTGIQIWRVGWLAPLKTYTGTAYYDLMKVSDSAYPGAPIMVPYYYESLMQGMGY